MLNAISSGFSSFVNQAYSAISGLLGKRTVVDKTSSREESKELSKINNVFEKTPKLPPFTDTEWRDHVRLNSDYFHQALQKLPEGPLQAGEHTIRMGENTVKFNLDRSYESKDAVIKHLIENGTLDKQAIQDGIDARAWNERISQMPNNKRMSVDEIWGDKKPAKKTAHKTNSLIYDLQHMLGSFKQFISQKLHLSSALKA